MWPDVRLRFRFGQFVKRSEKLFILHLGKYVFEIFEEEENDARFCQCMLCLKSIEVVSSVIVVLYQEHFCGLVYQVDFLRYHIHEES